MSPRAPKKHFSQMKYKRKINPCMPGFNASCSLCCGSHNTDEIITDSMKCPYISQIDENNTIGCLAYDNIDMLDNKMKEFFLKTCKIFYCRAWDVLSDREVIFAAELLKDWYYYSLLINDCQYLKEISKKFKYPGNISEDELNTIKNNLEKKLCE